MQACLTEGIGQWSQKSSKCGKNPSDSLGYRLVCHFFVLTTFWRRLWTITDQPETHHNMQSTCSSNMSFIFSWTGVENMKRFDIVSSPHTEKVVSGVLHALLSRGPQTHYVIGQDAIALAWLSMMPACIIDFLFRILATIWPGPGPKQTRSYCS